MKDSDYLVEPKKKPDPLLDYILIGTGLLFMLVAVVLLAFLLMRNGRAQAANPASNGEAFAFNGQQIHHVPAGSNTIEALAYSDQAPVVLMFDADW